MIKVMRQGIMWKNILRLLLKQLIFANFFTRIMRQGETLWAYLCDRVQGVEGFDAPPSLP